VRAFLAALLLALALPALAQAPVRDIPLEGTRNTRDLGGLPAGAGRVRAGMVYRSGALCFLSEADVERLKALGLQTLIDLRTRSEIERDGPDRLSLTDSIPVRLWLPMQSQGQGLAAYRWQIAHNDRVLRGFFGVLAEPASYPVLFHCSAGKDRTGILTALLLEALGTPRQHIMADYLRSQERSPALVVRPEWLQAVFEAVDQAGGIGPFLERAGVDAATQARLRTLLVVE
jgi:protein-tyrosine phosphatase